MEDRDYGFKNNRLFNNVSLRGETSDKIKDKKMSV